jgi:hypothetical protein
VSATNQVLVEPNAVFVGLSDGLSALCAEVLAPEGLRLHRFADVRAACDAIASALPELVVLPVTMRAEDLDMIEDRAIAVGATLLYLDPTHDLASVNAQLYATILDLRTKFAGRRR